jgi:BirA family biotin operon repressor/biotin-[acetyl-CoA-carboxylase] ligase
MSQLRQKMLAEDIRNRLSASAHMQIGDIDVVERLASTQNLLLSRASSSCWQLLVAVDQTAGVGRQLRFWQSGHGQVAFSIRGWVEEQASSIGLLSLLASLCVHDVLRSLGLTQVMLKWPNDVLIEYKKISGILISVSGSRQNKFDIVLGIGLNRLRLSEQVSGDGIGVVSLSDRLSSPPSQPELIASLLNAWFARLPLIASEQGRKSLVNEWQSYALWLNELVIVTLADRQIEGRFQGVALDGRLRLLTASGEQLFSVGEVRLRPLGQIN